MHADRRGHRGDGDRYLGLVRGALAAAIGLSLVSGDYAFMLNPTSAELGDAVDRRGLGCYAAVYEIYNIAYAVGRMAASGFASAASARLSFFQVLLCVSAALFVFVPLLLLRPSPVPQPSSPPSIRAYRPTLSSADGGASEFGDHGSNRDTGKPIVRRR
jgi:hypothetical protein